MQSQSFGDERSHSPAVRRPGQGSVEWHHKDNRTLKTQGRCSTHNNIKLLKSDVLLNLLADNVPSESGMQG